MRCGLGLLLLLALCTSVCNAQWQKDTSQIKTKKYRIKYEPGIEYIFPDQPRIRDVQTVSTNHFVGLEYFKRMHFSVFLGFTFTYAWGHISINEGSGLVPHPNSAFGVGPGFLIRFEPLLIKKFSFGMDCAGNILLYSRHFPYGADIYNFMLRPGGSVTYHIDKKNAIRLVGKWMHVSNGQGFTLHNPVYEGVGVAFEYTRYLGR